MLLKALLVVVIPVAALVIGLVCLQRFDPNQDIQKRAKALSLTPLNQRWGYTADEAHTYWQKLQSNPGKDLLPVERLMLTADLAYPFLYGGGFAVALLIAWWALGCTFSPLWLLAPVFAMVAADWTENLVQLGQIGRLTASPDAALSTGWMRLASAATMAKLVFLGVCSILTVGAAVCLVWLHFHRRS